MDRPDDLVLNSVNDVMARTRLGRTSVYRLLDDGEIESVKIGRRRMVPESSLRAYLDRLRSEVRSA